MTKILVIDDNEDVRDTLVTILEDAGYQIAIARDGEEGVKQFAAERPELVITDIFMPKQEGIQTIREILLLCPQARIIAVSGGMSGYGNGKLLNGFYLHLAQKLGAVDIIPKPFDIEDLVERIQRALQPSNLPQRNKA